MPSYTPRSSKGRDGQRRVQGGAASNAVDGGSRRTDLSVDGLDARSGLAGRVARATAAPMAPLSVPRHRAPAATAAAVSYTAVVVAFTMLTALLTPCIMARPAAAAAVLGAGTTRSRNEEDAAVIQGQGEKASGSDGKSDYDEGLSGHRLYRPGSGGDGGGGRGGGRRRLLGVQQAAGREAAAEIGTKAVGREPSPVERLIESTGSSGNLFHLDLTLLGGGGGGGGDGYPEDTGGTSEISSSNSSNTHRSSERSHQRQQQQEQQQPWFEGFTVAAAEADPKAGSAAGDASALTAAITIGHPVRRLLSYFVEEGVGLEEALSWTDGVGEVIEQARLGRGRARMEWRTSYGRRCLPLPVPSSV